MNEDHIRLAEALVFASTEPVGARALSPLLPEDADADAVLAALRDRCADRGVHLVEVAGGWQFRTAPDLAAALRRVVAQPRRLPRAAMETLAIVAYHQPVTRPEIEDMRGASLSQQTMDAAAGIRADRVARAAGGAGAADFVGHDARLPGAVRPEGPARSAEARGFAGRATARHCDGSAFRPRAAAC